jgi:hypothetical protein
MVRREDHYKSRLTPPTACTNAGTSTLGTVHSPPWSIHWVLGAKIKCSIEELGHIIHLLEYLRVALGLTPIA